MRSHVRFWLGPCVALSALLIACGSDPEPGSTTQGGSSSSAGSNQAGTLALGGTSSGGAGTGGSAAGKGGSSAGAGGSSAGGSQSGTGPGGSSTQGGQGGSSIFQPESAGTVSANVDGQKLVFDQAMLYRQVAADQYSVQATMKSGGNRKFIFTLSLFTGPGTYDCVNNLISLSNAAGDTAHATASDGVCSMTFSELPTADGGSLKGTFTATLTGTSSTVSVTDGAMDLKAPK